MVKNNLFAIQPIEIIAQPINPDIQPVFSILIVSWNNLEYLKLCVKSIQQNSSYQHQILIHVNEGTDGTLDWVKENKFGYSHSVENIGICYGANALSALIATEYVLLIDDDNYVAPEWDKSLLNEIKSIRHKYFALSSTRLEPYPNKDKTAITPVSFGTSAKDFNEKAFLEEYNNYKIDDWNGSSWYPMVIHRDLWFLVGGFSTEFSPGLGSDPDFSMKLWVAGVRYFKGLSNSRAYHFVSKTVGRVKKNDGKKQFILKWGMNISTFYKYYLRIGQPFHLLDDNSSSFNRAKRKIFFDRLRLNL